MSKTQKNIYIEEFLQHKRDRRYSLNTIDKYESSLNNFMHYLENTGSITFQEITTKYLEQYRLHLIEKNYSSHTVEAILQTVKQFFSFLAERGIIFEDPSSNFKIRRARAKLGYVMSEEEVKQLLAGPNLSEKVEIRDRAILEVLYSTGVRREEIVNMKIYDINTSQKTIKILGKGKKERVVPMGTNAVKYLKIYLKDVRQKVSKGKDLTDALWLNYRGKPLSNAITTIIVKKYVRRQNLSEEINTHALRRTCATHLLKNGAHPLMVANLLGHSTLKTLTHYLKTTITDLKKTHKSSNPGK